MSAANELREAAAVLRDRASAAVHEGRRTWATAHTLGSKSPVVVDDPERPSVLIESWAARLEKVNQYLALLGPATGLALADWLEHHAEQYDRIRQLVDGVPADTDHPAFAVARTLLGRTS